VNLLAFTGMQNILQRLEPGKKKICRPDRSEAEGRDLLLASPAAERWERDKSRSLRFGGKKAAFGRDDRGEEIPQHPVWLNAG